MKIFFGLIMCLLSGLALAGHEGTSGTMERSGSTDTAGTMGSGTTTGSHGVGPTHESQVNKPTSTSDAGVHDGEDNVSGRDTATPGAEGATPSGMDSTRPMEPGAYLQIPGVDRHSATPSDAERTVPSATDRTTTAATTGIPQPFGSVDSDGDGLVSRREGLVLENTGHSFAQGDADQDGYLSAGEYNRLVGSRTP